MAVLGDLGASGYAAYKGVEDLKNEKYWAATAHFGESLLRLVGITPGVRAFWRARAIAKAEAEEAERLAAAAKKAADDKRLADEAKKAADDARLAAEREAARIAAEINASLEALKTKPTGPLGGKPDTSRGEAKVSPKEKDDTTIASMAREKESPYVLAENGYKVQTQPPKPPPGNPDNLREKAKPDYNIEGRYFDNYAPQSKTLLDSIATYIGDKAGARQTVRVVLNLNDAPTVDLKALKDVLEKQRLTPDSGMSKVREIIIVKDGKVHHYFIADGKGNAAYSIP